MMAMTILEENNAFLDDEMMEEWLADWCMARFERTGLTELWEEMERSLVTT